MTCAPSVGVLEQSLTEQLVGQFFRDKFSQCCFHVPHLHALSAVPTLFFQPVAESPISFSLLRGYDDFEWPNEEVSGLRGFLRRSIRRPGWASASDAVPFDKSSIVLA